jgi:uncharacterized membrane protein YfcA
VDANDIGISILLFVLGALAAGGGVGGGGVFLPLLLLINDFTTQEAVPLSNVSDIERDSIGDCGI